MPGERYSRVEQIGELEIVGMGLRRGAVVLIQERSVVNVTAISGQTVQPLADVDVHQDVPVDARLAFLLLGLALVAQIVRTRVARPS
jgi:hypothetical protein